MLEIFQPLSYSVLRDKNTLYSVCVEIGAQYRVLGLLYQPIEIVISMGIFSCSAIRRTLLVLAENQGLLKNISLAFLVF